ncbi:hypothetical protein GCM10009801_68540 [Streptomyces albiaxialis]|uniref:Novel STAND NTPase 5 domain-containing protein n=1 Tax=Streptomyces albiaxialis TaxID=329523 RepID=A0ABP5IFY3_9ACTN
MDWMTIDDGFLANYREATDQEMVRYFDGAVPTWGTVVAGAPRREAASRITGRLLYEPLPASTLHLVIGPSGEGKSTLIRQVAADIGGGSPEWRVFWRPPGSDLMPERVADLDTDRKTLFVSDDAEEIAADCFEIIRRLEHRPDIHFLLAARDTDWLAARADSLPWRTLHLSVHRVPLRGLSEESGDAQQIVEAWAEYEALGQLASYNRVEDRARALLEATRGQEASRNDGALLGGMLRVRVGDRLDEHVMDMLRRLVRYRLQNGTTLANAFVHIAALHAIDVREMSPLILAETLGIDPALVEQDVVRPLGEEAAATRAGDRLLVRHRAIAESAMRVARNLDGMDLKAMYGNLTRAGIRVAKRPRTGVQAKAFRYLSQSLQSDPQLALASARAAVDEEPDDLRRVVNLFVVLRNNDLHDELSGVAEDCLDGLRSMVNYAEAARRFFYEWSIAEGQSGNHSIACWLTAVALADLPGVEPLQNQRDVELRTAGFAPGFKAMADRAAGGPFGRGLRAVETLLREWEVSARTRRDLSRYRSVADGLGVPELDPATCRTDLEAAIVGAWRNRSRNLHATVPRAPDLRFDTLFRMLSEAAR